MAVEAASPLAFTKLVVDDIDAMADYYCAVFGLHRGARETFENGLAGEPIEEISLTAAPGDLWGALTLLKFLDRPPAQGDETILGFTTSDLTALLERLERAGGTLLGDVKELPEHGVRAALSRDPEGHLNELIETRA